MAKQPKGYTVRCDACSFTATVGSEEAAQVIAGQHVGSDHRDANSAHMLGQHVHITAGDAEEAKE